MAHPTGGAASYFYTNNKSVELLNTSLPNQGWMSGKIMKHIPSVPEQQIKMTSANYLLFYRAQFTRQH